MLKRTLRGASVAFVLLLAACGSSGDSGAGATTTDGQESDTTTTDGQESDTTTTGEPAPDKTTVDEPAPDTTVAEQPSDGPYSIATAMLDEITGPITWPEPVNLSAPIDLTGKAVWFVPLGDAIAGMHTSGVALKEAVEAVGGEFQLCDGKFNPVDMGQCLKSAGEQGAAAVVTYYIDYALIPNAVDDLVAQGVPVLMGAAQAAQENSAELSFLDNSDLTIAMEELAAAAAISVVGESETPSAIAIMLQDTPGTQAATEAMVAEYESLCPDCKIATLDFASANADKLGSNMSAELVKNPDANVILVPDDGLVPPVRQALSLQGREEALVVSPPGNLAGLQAIESGQLAGSVGVPTAYHGWVTANALFQMLTGDELTQMPLTFRYFDSSNIGEFALTADAYASGEWYGDDSYKSAYKQAWGVG